MNRAVAHIIQIGPYTESGYHVFALSKRRWLSRIFRADTFLTRKKIFIHIRLRLVAAKAQCSFVTDRVGDRSYVRTQSP